ncbi:MAG TPA: CPBP family intramembrane glutamic endopeptidase [Pilimelia sp.]|nr:CPBP family intramembrane glutamic endopeptidase [Pilimelia sp.]
MVPTQDPPTGSAPPLLPDAARVAVGWAGGMGVLLGVLFGGPAVAARTGLDTAAALALVSLLLPAAMVAYVVLLCTVVDRRPAAQLGLRPRGRDAVRGLAALCGVALAVVAVTAGCLVTGHARWLGWQGLAAGAAAAWLGLLPAVCAQAFPEEVLFRGYLYRTVAHRRTAAVAAGNAGLFGLIHLLSRSDASGGAERAGYVVMAAALGWLLVALRVRTGTVWAAIGGHTGHHLATRAAFELLAPTSTLPWLLGATVVYAGVGTALLAPRLRAPA